MSPKTILIVSFPEDLHARAVAWAIRQHGHRCVELSCADFPTRTLVTMTERCTPRGSSLALRSSVNDLSALSDAVDTVWLRRWNTPWLPDSMHPGDREVATRQCSRALWDVLAGLEVDAPFWVNHYEKDESSQLKISQLRTARRSGLNIPHTIISNDPKEIKSFISACGGLAAHKLLEHATWRSSETGHIFSCYTSPVSIEQLPSDDTLRLCPGIFQPLLEKAFEIRVSCFGDELVALKIDSQSDDRARIDWRAGQWYVDMQPYALPDTVASGIRRYIRGAGLAFASMDFVVTPTGEHVFLEANPQGQFLWMEDRARMPVLDICTQYLIDGRLEFRARDDLPRVSWTDFLEAWEGGLKTSIEGSVLERETMAVPE